jgi:Flp pilus assembly protein TadB
VNRLRLGFALAGFVLALFSVALEDMRLGWAAIAVLLVSLIVRLLLRKREEGRSKTNDRL